MDDYQMIMILSGRVNENESYLRFIKSSLESSCRHDFSIEER